MTVNPTTDAIAGIRFTCCGVSQSYAGVLQSGPTWARSLVRLVSGATLAEHLGMASRAEYRATLGVRIRVSVSHWERPGDPLPLYPLFDDRAVVLSSPHRPWASLYPIFSSHVHPTCVSTGSRHAVALLDQKKPVTWLGTSFVHPSGSRRRDHILIDTVPGCTRAASTTPLTSGVSRLLSPRPCP
ncbi:hypothetical protein FA13DRAFT_174863 [Coprinellus micaceus]|uniref:Uncharacterized protein n=1 Tax=Coprinellus micaceus TaxID=71717 RepID=A0A4Y7SI33_COPMI|nr:hypothetical protein FA13DRAFT_174863 [Coprinellus micaceus]